MLIIINHDGDFPKCLGEIYILIMDKIVLTIPRSMI